MRNPFQYGSVVRGGAFCNRRGEVRDIRRASFAVTTARALAQAHASTPKKLLEAARELTEVLEAPAKVANSTGRRVTVVFDECQRILEYESDLVERTLRSVTQHQPDVAYLFLGSRKHLIRTMFLDESRPLYRSAGHYPLRPIEAKEWTPFVRKRFRDGKREIADELVTRVCDLTQGHPFYTQHLCHALWEICPTGGAVDEEMIDAALDVLLERESFAYTTLWESLTKNQRRFLTGLALEPAGVQPFSADFTRRYGLRSASNAQRAVEGLLDRDVIDNEESTYIVTDRFLRLWIRRTQGRR